MRLRRSTTAVATGAVSCFAAACTLLVSTDGLSEPGSPGTDASLERADEVAAAASDAFTDAGRVDAGWLGGESRCASSKFILCDGFEADSGAWASPPRFDRQRSARGGMAYHAFFFGDGGRQTDYISARQALPFPSAGVFVRGFVYVPSGQFIPDGGILWIFKDGDPYPGADLGFFGGKLRSRAKSGASTIRVSATAMPLDRWVCLEMELSPNDATSGRARFWMDEVPLDDLTIPSGVVTEAPDIFEVGLEAQVTGPSRFDMWFDEVADDVVRIGCAR
jgi:hypothetical protein